MRNSVFSLLGLVAAVMLALAVWGSPEITPRPYVNIIALLLAGSVLWAVGMGYRSSAHQPAAIAWKATARFVGWVGAAVSIGVVGLLLVADFPTTDPMPWVDKARVIEIVIPLVMGIQAALIFSPDDEPAMEVMLACPRPIGWLLLERLGIIFLTQGAVALMGIGLSLVFIDGQSPLVMLLRWIPPAVFLSGVGIYVTLRSRVAAFGVAVTALLWFALLFFAESLLPGAPTIWPLNYVQPFLWVIEPFVTPSMLSNSDYWLNRVSVTLLGTYLILSVLANLRDEEYILLGVRTQSTLNEATS